MSDMSNKKKKNKDLQDVENYTKPTISGSKYYDKVTNDPRMTSNKVSASEYKDFIKYQGKLTAGMKPISRALADLNEVGGRGASGATPAYQKSWIAKGAKASALARMKAKKSK